MHRLTSLIILALATGVSHAQDERFALYPRYATGQRYSVQWHSRWALEQMQVGNITSPVTGANQYSIAAEVTITDARDGRLAGLSISFGPCEATERALATFEDRRGRLLVSNQTLRLTIAPMRAFTYTPTGPVPLGALITQGGFPVSDPDTLWFAVYPKVNELLPAYPVPVGGRWTTQDLEGLLGPGATGSAQLRLDRVEPGLGGRARAVVVVESGTGRPSRLLRFQSTIPLEDPVVAFTGTIVIDLADGMISSIDLQGERRASTSSGGPAVNEREYFVGPWAFLWRNTRLAPLPIATPAPPPAPVVGARAVSPLGLFEVSAPAGWSATPRADGSVWLTRAGSSARIRIGVEPAGNCTTPAEFFKTALAPELSLRGGQILEQAAADVGGQAGHAASYRRPSDRPPLRGFVLTALAGPHAILFRAEIPSIEFDTISHEIESIRRWFHVRRASATRAQATTSSARGPR